MSGLRNPFAAFAELLAPGPRQAGTVSVVDNGVATVDLPGGGQLRALGDVTVGAHVFVRDGVIEGPAPSLPVDSASL